MSVSGQELHLLLSDAGVYSYAAMCSLLLHELFPRDYDRQFAEQCIHNVIQHLRLPKQVEGVMMSLFEGDGSQCVQPYIELLLAEPKLGGRAVLLVQDLILLAVKGGCYDARMRVLIKRVAELLDIPLQVVDLYEESFVEYLLKERAQTEAEKGATARRQRNKKVKRFALIGLATVGGGALIGLTGGLAAPLIGAGLGTILGGASMAVLTSTAAVAVIGSLFGVAGAGLTGFKMKKRVGDVEEFSFAYLNCDNVTQQLHLTIAVSGWLSDDLEDNFARPWHSLVISREQYCLRYESKYLLELGKAMEMILNFAITVAAQQALRYTILSGLLAAITWPANLLTLASVIDNPWGVSCRRASEVGKQLAEVLLAREQGQRPVTLVGFSLGARVIYYCLREMSQREGCEGIVQDAILLGAPVTGSPDDWKKLTRVVAGRLVNGYCRSDWLLKFLYRKLSVTSEVAGLQPVTLDDPRLVNVDVGDVIQGHSEYPEKIAELLKCVGVEAYADHFATQARLMKTSASEIPRSRSSTFPNTSLASLRPSQSESNLSHVLVTRGNAELPTSVSSQDVARMNLDSSTNSKQEDPDSTNSKQEQTDSTNSQQEDTDSTTRKQDLAISTNSKQDLDSSTNSKQEDPDSTNSKQDFTDSTNSKQDFTDSTNSKQDFTDSTNSKEAMATRDEVTTVTDVGVVTTAVTDCTLGESKPSLPQDPS